jgi:CP family cyanate transporter-like MFS transporter
MSAGFQRGAEIFFVALVALNLRPFLAGPGPVLDRIGQDTGLGPVGLSLITLGPLALIGAGALATPAILRHVAARRVILCGLALIAVGCGLRVLPSGAMLIATAAICGMGTALLQAVMPAAIRDRFGQRYSAVMSLYSACLLAGGAVGAQAVPLITLRWDWAVGLAAMGILAAGAFVFGLALRRFDMAPPDLGGTPMGTVLRSRRTWHLIACFGALNASYATVITWIGPQFAARDVPAGQIGFLIAVMSVAQALIALGLPSLMSRPGERRLALSASVAAQIAGFALLMTGVASPLVTVIVLGAGLGGTFSLMMVAILDCAKGRDSAVKLSAAVQGGGFILNAGAPLCAALVLQAFGGFASVWLMHIVLLLLAVPLVWTMPRTAQ